MEKISDISDRATRLEELETEARVRAVRAAAKQLSVQPTGECLSCGEELEGDRRWCDAYCRDDWERENRGRKLRGH